MKRPKKKIVPKLNNKYPSNEYYIDRLESYNRACDEWEKYLPNKKELVEIVSKVKVSGMLRILPEDAERLAEIIFKRLRSEKK